MKPDAHGGGSKHMESFEVSKVVRRCVDEIHQYSKKTHMPDYAYASLVAVLAAAARKTARLHQASAELAGDSEEEVFVHGFQRWLDEQSRLGNPRSSHIGDIGKAMEEFRYMSRHGRRKPVRKSSINGSKAGKE